MLTKHYESTISGDTVKRGVKGTAFQVPPALLKAGLKRSTPLLITIAAAFVRPLWTLVFVDHQCFMTFHIMRLRRPCSPADFVPNSLVILESFCAVYNIFIDDYRYGSVYGARTMALYTRPNQMKLNILLTNFALYNATRLPTTLLSGAP